MKVELEITVHPEMSNATKITATFEDGSIRRVWVDQFDPAFPLLKWIKEYAPNETDPTCANNPSYSQTVAK